MIDKNIISSTIRTLERVIGILENCKDTNEMSEATRRRVVEMLNSAMLDSAFITQGNEGVKENTISESEISISEKKEVAKQPLVEFDLSPTVNEEKLLEEEKQRKAEEERIEAERQKQEQEKRDLELRLKKEEEERVQKEKAQLEEEERKRKHAEDIVRMEAEVEAKRIAEENRQEREKREKEIEEKNNKLQQQQEELTKLQEQLENERKRLEEELKSWNSEKQKKEEDALLKVLEQEKQKKEEQKKQEVIEVKIDMPVFEVPVEEVTRTINQEEIKEIVTPPIAPVTPTVQKEEKRESLINKFLGTKKVVNETFEYESISTQGLTPIPQLSKAIGINDKFQFIKELFGGDADLYNETIEALNNVGTFESGIDYIKSNFEWDDKNPTIRAFVTLLRRRYME